MKKGVVIANFVFSIIILVIWFFSMPLYLFIPILYSDVLGSISLLGLISFVNLIISCFFFFGIILKKLDKEGLSWGLVVGSFVISIVNSLISLGLALLRNAVKYHGFG